MGEVTVDTQTMSLRVHDGVAAGGVATVSADGTQTLTNKTLTSPVISSPTVTGAGSISITGNITGGNIISSALVSTVSVSASGNITGGNLTTGAQVVATGNVTGGNLVTAGLITATGNISATANVIGGNITTAGIITVNSDGAATAIVNGGSNAAGNIGSASSYFNRLFATSTSALYADLAEVYESDEIYEPGTVLVFGGEREVTLCDSALDTRIAGVVSTDPSFVMNSGCPSAVTATVALLGKVPTKVSGVVNKGDIMVSAGNGRAQSAAGLAHIPTGSVLGKSLENFPGGNGVIQIVVGRM